MSEAIEVRHVDLTLSHMRIHHDVNVSIKTGEIMAIVGGSGSGKTTLLREILGLQPIDAGSIRVLGCDMSNPYSQEALKIKQHWGVVFQQNALFSSMTILENTTFPLREFTHLSRAEIKERGLAKMRLAGLHERTASQYPSELSGGMQKRAAIARAIIMDPHILFLDEATAGLDPEGASELDELVLQLKKQIKMTIVMVTHDLYTLYSVPDRITFLGDTTVLCCGDLPTVMHHPHPLIQRFFNGSRGRYHGNNS